MTMTTMMITISDGYAFACFSLPCLAELATFLALP